MEKRMAVPKPHTPDYRRILDLLSDMVLVLDGQGIIIAANSAASAVARVGTIGARRA